MLKRIVQKQVAFLKFLYQGSLNVIRCYFQLKNILFSTGSSGVFIVVFRLQIAKRDFFLTDKSAPSFLNDKSCLIFIGGVFRECKHNEAINYIIEDNYMFFINRCLTIQISLNGRCFWRWRITT